MGSFNATCGVSKLPIQYGDPVRWFFIGRKPDEFQLNLIDRNSRWLPLSVPLVGKYDDYGAIESIERNTVSVLQEKWLKKDSSLISKRSEPHSLEDLQAIVCACQRDVLLVRGPHGRPCQTAPFIVHEEIYHEVCQIGLAEGMPSVFEVDKEPELRVLMRKFFELLRPLGDTPSLEDALRRSSELSDFRLPEERSIVTAMGLLFADLPQETWKMLEEAFVEFRGFLWGMEQLRRDWMPSLRNTQNTDLDVHHRFLRAVAHQAYSLELKVIEESDAPTVPGYYWAKLQLSVNRVSNWQPVWWDQPSHLIAMWGPRCNPQMQEDEDGSQ